MIVKITDIAANGPKGSTIFKFVDANGKEDSLLIWTTEVYKIKGFKVGDWVDLEYKMNGKYKNFVSIKGAQAPEGVQTLAPTKNYEASPYQKPKDPEEQLAIARAVALDKAIMFHEVAKIKPSVGVVCEVADLFLAWLRGKPASAAYEPVEVPEV